MDKQPTLAIIGFGRLGGALAQLARDRGYRIAAVAAASARPALKQRRSTFRASVTTARRRPLPT